MTKQHKLSPSLRRLSILCVGAVLLLALACLRLLAQESSPLTSSQPDPTSSAYEDPDALLPTIPAPLSEGPHLVLPKGVAPGIIGRIPGEPVSNPDEFKVLYGYSGPYYNTTDLDGSLVVLLDKSVYTWPIATWKVSGLLRNQTRSPVQVTGVTAQLIGLDGEVLATAKATLAIEDVRPGEPAPFIIDAPLARTDIKSINWNVDFEPAQVSSRLFTFEIYEDRISMNGSRYDFGGIIRNAASAPIPRVRVIAAWLDDENRVIYIDSLKLRLIADPAVLRDSVDLGAGEDADFLYLTTDHALASLLKNARVALWGVPK